MKCIVWWYVIWCQSVAMIAATILPANNGTRVTTEQELRLEKQARRERTRKRQEAFREALRNMPPPESLEKVEMDQWYKFQGDRNLGWLSSSGSAGYTTSSGALADPSQEYDKWAQAYRMMGGFIDCAHSKDEDHHDDKEGEGNGGKSACSRWMMWAAYVNPNYQGNGYDEYYGDNAVGSLDCHNPDTEWKLLGVYRQEFYQYIEQISKHLWAIDDYEYVVALAGLAYMTDSDCFYVGTDKNGNSVYAGVAPKPYGYFEMALYTDDYCLTPNDSLGKTYDDYGLQSGIDLGSKDATDDDGKSWAYDWWYNTQEYTLTNLNEVYNEFKYCTSCVDYPTYQDGYFIGDDGTDDDDLINQCWKFYSHDSFTCEAECIDMAHRQGTILSLQYGDTTFGSTSSSFYKGDPTRSSSPRETYFTRLMANAFLTLSFLLFVATFLAFAVARRSRYRESRSSRSHRLLDEEGGQKSRKGESDGLFRSASSSRRKSSRSKSKTRSSKTYEPPAY